MPPFLPDPPPSSPAEQVKQVRKVKSYENGFISNPAVMSPAQTVADLDALKAERNISGGMGGWMDA